MGLSRQSESYLLGGSTLVLTQFNKMKDLVPIPYVGPALDVVQGIVDIVKTIRDNQEKCHTLLEDLGCLMVVVMRPLVGLRDVPVELRENLSDLTTRLLDIKQALELFRAARWYDQLLRSDDRKATLDDRTDKMKSAPAMFNVSQQIDAALSAEALSTQVTAVQTQVKDVQFGVSSANGKLDTVIATLTTTATAGIPRELASTVLPPKPKIILGRDEEIETIAMRLFSTDDGCFVIRGPGGIGKTTIVSAIAYHKRVVEKFGDRVKWVPCSEATTPELLLELVARSVGVTTDSPGQDRKERIINILRSSVSPGKPQLIICDNFETPWDAPGGQGAVADVLQTITSVPGVNLLLTMRGHTPPAAGRIAWSEPHLEPLSTLSLEASRELYLQIHGEALKDPQLDELLYKLSYMPLAVRLAATYGSDGGVMPAALVKRWDSRTIVKALDHSDERTESISFSVKLSIQSNAVKRAPEALTLLTILAHLPGGAHREFIPQFAPFDADLVDDAITTLMKVSLIQMQGTAGLFTMLSPVRTVVLESHPIDEQHRVKLLFVYYQLIAAHSSSPGDANHLQNMSLLRTEHVNCETLLRWALGTAPPSEDCIEATCNFAQYLYWTFPDPTLISVAVDKARSLQSDRKSHILAECLFQLGENQSSCNMYPASEAALKEAGIVYQEIGDVLGQAKALKSLGDTYRMLDRYEDALGAGEQARSLYKQVGQVHGQANALQSLCNAYRMLHRYDEAVGMGEQARVLYKQNGSVLGEGNALRSLSNAYRMLHRYNDAIRAGEQAVALYRQIGSVVGEANGLDSLGDAYRMTDRVEDAIQAGQQALTLYLTLGYQSGIGNAFWSLALALQKQGNLDDALVSARGALESFSRIGSDRETVIMKGLVADIEASRAEGDLNETGGQVA